jgi:uncharacterized membrane protein YphA (DoxX/SURF4 family)
MKKSTAILLILLRLSIGWHFLYEGLHKWHTIQVGETATNRPFSSAGYFREAPGPLGKYFRRQLGLDADERLLAELTPLPVPAGQDPVTYPLRERMPPPLKQQWQDYVARFEQHFQLDAEQRKRARAVLEQAESQIVTWLTRPDVDEHTPKVVKNFPTGQVEQKLTVPHRVAEYKAELHFLRDTQERRLQVFNHDVEGKRLAAKKADVAQLRTSLANDLKAKTEEYLERPLKALLNENEVLLLAGASTAGLLGAADGEGPLLVASTLYRGRLEMPEAKATLPEPEGHTRQWWLDRVTVWFLIVVGGLLMVGLFTRLDCVLLAGFLFTTFLLWPPFPWLPASPLSEGNYAYVNKNLIEMLALLALATTASGRWFGLDALLRWGWSAFRGRRVASRPAVRRAA